ncbi:MULTISPECIES: isochorismatase family protein [unclassified Prochlorococcus]|uniref:isochorismatase family protein n=1 Tax=unclassified Prochlorococcus TaxID=2627481 RepID=UPI00068AADCA|nr:MULTISPECIES: isochorismatase family protein [unclassified Prochlorococcus]
MSSKLLDSNKTALVLIDFQEKLIQGVNNKDKVLFNINRLIDIFKIIDLEIFITEQNPDKLGKTVSEVLGVDKFRKYSKMGFSCTQSDELIRELKENKIINLLLCGVETHVCIFQSAIMLNSKGINVHVVADASGSRKEFDHNIAIERLRSLGITITSTEMAIFEMCKTANHKEFKRISAVIKREI